MKSAPPCSESPSACVNGAVRRTSRRLAQIYDEAFAPCGLKATQYAVLNQISKAGTPKMGELAQTLVMDLSALGHTLKPLVRDGLVELRVDELDRRTRRVLLTEVGVQTHATARGISVQMAERFDQAFGREAAAQLRQTLDFIASDEFARTLLAKDD
ncbi:MarR family winged helix-turn-helix transcriptional regulator [Pseudomonas costantinii]|uniref:DNA-binding transcriptional regulator, MarR family n=1 Tax=Pseudomonas costantinii TaxID=168469 RepID=A0A1S2UFW2_9PSED|nr:MarR family transcriptional regulator [Pseudomonas costantinii]NVZ22385.1 MarR family transcriptional regulator [Pseudomonas costantinii]OIN45337.1 MarR family transcriptional regulator [Pseudomonas costantinii]SED38080.1 DNA-binding transcriptional regulator, MarR family [Pseudomonas costantinii]